MMKRFTAVGNPVGRTARAVFCVFLSLFLAAGAGFASYAEERNPIDYTTGTPWPDIDLEGVVTEDTKASLKDNFALYVNKDAILSLTIPEGYSRIGTMMDAVLQANADVKAMFLGEAPKEHDALLAYNLYGLLMDWDSRNALGVQPLKEQVASVDAIGTVDALLAYLLKTPQEDRLFSLWQAGSDTDLTDSSRRVLTVGMCDLLLVDSAEYTALTDFGAIKKEAYTQLARKMLLKLGYSEEEAQQKIGNCLAYETLIAPTLYTNEQQSSADYYSRIINRYSREALEAAQGKLPILAEFAHMGYPEEKDYLVVDPAFLSCLNEVLTEENLPLARDYLIVHGVLSAANSLDRECYEWSCEANNAISGAAGMLDDETAFASRVSALLPWPVARLYTQTYLKQEDKDRITAVVDEIVEAYHGILNEADFLSEETRKKAIEKLEAIGKGVLYPDDWEKYECADLEFAPAEDGGTLWEALRSIRRYANAKAVKEFSEPVDKQKWEAPPQTMNCFYNPLGNCIVIMGAFARGNIYNSGMSDEEVLGKLGIVIGHEISHAFDRSGAQFDKDGNMANWWTEADYAEFLKRNQKLAAYYNAMHPWEGQNFYGGIMTGEACADMAGVKVALRVAAGKEDFDYDAFFRAYADLWLEKGTLQAAYVRINDVHPMSYLRVNGSLQQYDEFLDFYGITEGDGMYLSPEDRVLIW